MSKNKVQEKLDILLNKVNKPARYIGGEPGSIIKKDGEFNIRFAFCFPDTYEIGMSSMGLALLYNVLNKSALGAWREIAALGNYRSELPCRLYQHQRVQARS